MTKYRYDRDMGCMVEVRDQSNYFEEKSEYPTPAIIRDDIGAGVKGLRHMSTGRYFDSKSAFRKETKRCGMEEVGNDLDMASKQPELKFADYRGFVQDAWDQFKSNWNGQRDIVRKIEAQTNWRKRNERRY